MPHTTHMIANRAQPRRVTATSHSARRPVRGRYRRQAPSADSADRPAGRAGQAYLASRGPPDVVLNAVAVGAGSDPDDPPEPSRQVSLIRESREHGGLRGTVSPLQEDPRPRDPVLGQPRVG